jgi:lysophospholipase L1-like esterase
VAHAQSKLKAPGAVQEQARKSCKAPSELLRLEWPLPRMTEAFRKGEVIRIVALGSSSTLGTGASSQAASYPSRLLIELQQRFPEHKFEVINLGIGGQLASDMLSRIGSAVVPLGPELVIWQTGVNDAIRGVKVSDFSATVEAGLDILQKHRIDVILLNHQYYPGAARLPHFPSYLRAMKVIASERKVPLLRRYEIMQHMVTSSQFSVEELLAPDKFHLNDTSYRCLGAAVADALALGLSRVAAKAGGGTD